MRRLGLQALIIFACLALPVVVFMAQGRRASTPLSVPSTSPTTESRPHAQPLRTTVSKQDAVAVAPEVDPRLLPIFHARPGAERRAALLALRRDLLALPPEQALHLIQAWLDAAYDLDIDAPLHVGPEGKLLSVPTLRAFWLDLWYQLDPVGAAREADHALDGSTTAVDFAVRLRNYARGTVDNPVLARERLGRAADALLRQEAWRQTGGDGFAEACDVFVAAGRLDLAPSLLRWTFPDAPTPGHKPAWLVLERFAAEHPAAVLPALVRESIGESLGRAGLLARARLDDPDQAGAAREYLIAPWVPETEKQRFLRQVPNLNYNLVAGLASNPWVADPSSSRIRAQAAVTWLQRAAADPALAAWREPLSEARLRVLGLLGD